MKELPRRVVIAWTLLAIVVAGATSILLQPHFDAINIAMVYMLAVEIVAFLLGFWPAAVTALVGVTLFDFLNLPPYFVFTGDAINYWFTLGVMVATAFVISTLAGRLRLKAAEAEARRERTEALYTLSTELRERATESELRAQRETLRSSILGAVSHDLKTPLATIIGASSTLLEEGDDFTAETRHRLRTLIVDESAHMLRMVENLLDMAQLSSGAVKPALDWQAIEEIIGSALVSLRRRIHDHSLQIGVPADLPLIRCDSVLMERVVINLVENAAKYSPAGTAIRIEVAASPGYLLLRVQDQGPGIPESLREQVFEPFFQSSPTNAGGGLGLSICRGIVAAQGGTIRIDAAAGGGTVVTVALPIPADTPSLEVEPEA